MSSTSRRAFVVRSAAVLSTARAIFARESLRASNLGVQLYTVRSIIDKDPASVLKQIQQIGYTEIEATYANLRTIWPGLKETSLQPVSVHVDLAILKDSDKVDGVLADLKERGFKYVVVPYIPPAQRGGAEMFKSLADTLNKIGRKADSNGLKLCYHNHAFEFQPQGNQTGFELMMDAVDKKLVWLELDVFWVTVAGHDPAQVLNDYAGRVALVHLKDKSKTFTTTQFNENVPKDTFKEVGSGTIDIDSVLKAADRAGVEHYFVEQDQTAGSPIESLRKSYEFLRTKFNS